MKYLICSHADGTTVLFHDGKAIPINTLDGKTVKIASSGEVTGVLVEVQDDDIECIGFSDKVKKIAECKQCGAILRYLPKNVKFQGLCDQGEFAGGYNYITCPHCKNEVKCK